MSIGNPNPVAPTYYDCGLPEMDGNPFARSVGSLLSREKLGELLNKPIKCDDEDRSLPPQVRKTAAARIRNIFISTPTSLDVAENIQRLMKVGYLHRNPLDPTVDAWRKLIVRQLRILGKEKMISKSECGMKIPGVPTFRSAPLCMGLFGLPATGKSGLVERILESLYFDRVIKHPNINGEERTMVKYLHLQVSLNSSSRGMIIGLIDELGKLVGENFKEALVKQNKGNVEDVVLPELVNLLLLYDVGAIFIDEIELIRAAYSRGDAGLKNLWLLLMNTCRVPLILIGNPDARQLFEDEFKLQHRLCSAGSTIFDRLLNVKGGEFRFFAETLFENQFTVKPTEMTPEIMTALHTYSGGLIKVLIMLMDFVHQDVIGRSTDEQITPDAIREAARKHAAIIENTINGLNSGSDESNLPADVQIKVLRPFVVQKETPKQEVQTAAAIALPRAEDKEEKVPRIVKSGKPKAGKRRGSLMVGERKADCLADYALKEVKGELTTYDMLKRDGFIANTADIFAAA